MIKPQHSLTLKEESLLDLISNAIIDIILDNQDKTIKTPLQDTEKGNNVFVKACVKLKV